MIVTSICGPSRHSYEPNTLNMSRGFEVILLHLQHKTHYRNFILYHVLCVCLQNHRKTPQR